MQNDLAISTLNDAWLLFPENWSGDLPKIPTRDVLRSQMAHVILERQMTASEAEEFLDLLEMYEREYVEIADGRFYHRACGGGAMMRGKLGVYCANCGKLQSLLPSVLA
jgi:hypothetical protein